MPGARTCLFNLRVRCQSSSGLKASVALSGSRFRPQSVFYGSLRAQAGTVSSTIVITSVVLFVPSEFWIRLCLCLVGFSWALLLSPSLWPLAPYTPALVAISAGVARLADLSIAFWAGAAAPGQFANNLPFGIAYDSLRIAQISDFKARPTKITPWLLRAILATRAQYTLPGRACELT